MVWQKAAGNGKVDETVEEPDLISGKVTIEGALGKEFSFKERGALEQTLAALSQNPETAWIAEFAKDPNVRFQLQKEYHKHWKYKQSGMAPGASVVVAIAFTIATGGTGAPAGGVLAAASGAAISSLESAVIIGTINNQGRVDKAFKDATSKKGIKNIAMTAVTAGATNGLTNALNIPASTTSVSARVQNVAVQRGVNVAVSTTIGGEKLSDSVKTNAIGGLVDFGAGLAAQKIGEAYHGDAEQMAESMDKARELGQDTPLQTEYELNYVTHKLAHAGLGAAVAAATGGDVLTGAIAAPLGEIIGEAYGKAQQKDLEQQLQQGGMSEPEIEKYIADVKENAAQYARLGSGAIALVAGRDVSTAVHVSGNAAENNIAPALVAGAIVAYEIYNVYDTAMEAYEGLDAYQKGDTDKAIEQCILVGMAVVPGEKLIPAPMRKAMAGFVKSQATKLMKTKLGKAATKVGGELVDAAGAKVQGLSKKVTDSTLIKGAGKGLADRGVKQAENSAAQGVEKGVDLSPRVKQNYWDDVDHFTAHGQTNKVYKRDDLIDLNRVDPRTGLNNAQRMEKGWAPIGPDNKPMNLHHMTQTQNGGIAEMTQTFHQKYSKVIHINPSTTPSGINRSSFDKWREEYWMYRLGELPGGKK